MKFKKSSIKRNENLTKWYECLTKKRKRVRSAFLHLLTFGLSLQCSRSRCSFSFLVGLSSFSEVVKRSSRKLIKLFFLLLYKISICNFFLSVQKKQTERIYASLFFSFSFRYVKNFTDAQSKQYRRILFFFPCLVS